MCKKHKKMTISQLWSEYDLEIINSVNCLTKAKHIRELIKKRAGNNKNE